MRRAWPRRTKGTPTEGNRQRGSAKAATGRVIEESAEETARRAQAAPPPAPGLVATLEAALETRHRQEAEARRAAQQDWLRVSGFAARLAEAEAALRRLPVARDEHRQAVAEHAATFDRLEAGLDQLFVPAAFRGEIAALRVRGECYGYENEHALRQLLARVHAVDLRDPNGAAQNPNAATAWRRLFTELMPHLPPAGWTKEHRAQVHRLVARIEAARRLAGRA